MREKLFFFSCLELDYSTCLLYLTHSKSFIPCRHQDINSVEYISSAKPKGYVCVTKLNLNINI